MRIEMEKKYHDFYRKDRMIDLLKNKKTVFFDAGYTLDAPAPGDWMFTNKFLELAGKRLKARSIDEIREAMESGLRYLVQEHPVTTVDAELRQFFQYWEENEQDEVNLVLFNNITIILLLFSKCGSVNSNLSVNHAPA